MEEFCMEMGRTFYRWCILTSTEISWMNVYMMCVVNIWRISICVCVCLLVFLLYDGPWIIRARHLFYFFFFLVVLLSFAIASPLRFWLFFCWDDVVNTPVLAAPPAGVELPLPVFFFLSSRSFSSSSWFSRSMRVIKVLQRRCNSKAVRDFKNQSKRNWGDELLTQENRTESINHHFWANFDH